MGMLVGLLFLAFMIYLLVAFLLFPVLAERRTRGAEARLRHPAPSEVAGIVGFAPPADLVTFFEQAPFVHRGEFQLVNRAHGADRAWFKTDAFLARRFLFHVYDDTVACQHTYVAATTTLVAGAGNVTFGPYTCGVGATQLTPLILDGRRIPKGKDFARTIASEEIVSERAKSVFEGLGVTGVAFEPVSYRGLRPKLEQWYQMIVRSTPADVVAPTVAGVEPFDLDDIGTYRCPYAHSIGFNLLSELSIERP